MHRSSQLISLFESVLRLCNVQANETLVVLTEGDDYATYAESYLCAAAALGAHAFHLRVPTHPVSTKLERRTGVTGNKSVVTALQQADIVIDTVGLLWSKEQRAILDSGTRMLMCREHPETIARLLPTEALKKRILIAQSMLAAAKRLRVTSPAGTDVSYRLEQFPEAMGQCGYVTEPGQWDNIPSGFVAAFGDEDGVDGVIVIDPGAILLPAQHYVSAPIKLTIEKGRIEAIEGNNLDADLFRSHMQRWNDPQAYAMSHIGWGMNEKAHWDTLAVSPPAGRNIGMEARAFYGNVLFSTGPNTEIGGSNDSGCHFDIPLRNCSLYLDDEQILSDGDIVPPSLRVEIGS